jgi:hypothetical protein
VISLGLPLTSIGVQLTVLRDWMTVPAARRDITAIPGQLAGRAGPSTGATDRLLTVGVRLPATLLTDRAALQARVESAVAGLLPLTTVDRPGIRTWVVRREIVWQDVPNVVGLTYPGIDGLITLRAVHGGSEDVTGRVYALSSSDTEIALGTLPSTGWLTLWGGTSPVVVTEVDGRGAGVSALTVTRTMATGASVALDLARREAWYTSAAGVRSAADDIVSGDWPTLDPEGAVGRGLLDGFSAVRYPSLRLSSGSGQLVTRRRWRI